MPQAAHAATPPPSPDLSGAIDRLTFEAGRRERRSRKPEGPLAFHRVVVAVDGSESARHALGWARELGALFRSEVTVAHVVPSPDMTDRYLAALGALGGGSAAGRLADEFEQRGRELVDAAVQELAKADVPAKPALVFGPAALGIVRVATKEHADLVVLGSHGRGPLGRAFLGSVADTVKDHVRGSILLARTPVPPLRVLAATDGSRASKRAAAIALTRCPARWRTTRPSPLAIDDVNPPRFGACSADGAVHRGHHGAGHRVQVWRPRPHRGQSAPCDPTRPHPTPTTAHGAARREAVSMVASAGFARAAGRAHEGVKIGCGRGWLALVALLAVPLAGCIAPELRGPDTPPTAMAAPTGATSSGSADESAARAAGEPSTECAVIEKRSQEARFRQVLVTVEGCFLASHPDARQLLEDARQAAPTDADIPIEVGSGARSLTAMLHLHGHEALGVALWTPAGEPVREGVARGDAEHDSYLRYEVADPAPGAWRLLGAAHELVVARGWTATFVVLY